MSYQLPFFPDNLTGEVIPQAILKLLVGRVANERGLKSLDLAIGIFADVAKSRAYEPRRRFTLDELFSLASVDEEGKPRLDKDGNPVRLGLSQEAIARIHASAAEQCYQEIAAVFAEAQIPSFFDGAVEV